MAIDPKVLAELVKGLQAAAAAAPAEEDWAIDDEPMEITVGAEVSLGDYQAMITQPDDDVSEMKTLMAVPTGTIIDELFLLNDGTPLYGLPAGANLALTGLAGSGKSVLSTEAVIRTAARGVPTLYVTSEDVYKGSTHRLDLQSRMMKKAEVLGLDWEAIKDNLIIMDAVANRDLRDWKTFSETYKYACESRGIQFVIIDSVTMLEDKRNSLKFRVMEISRYNQVKGITCILVNQRTSDKDWDSYAMAGGHGIAHAVDGTIIVDKGRTYQSDQVNELGKRGTSVRMIRVMDCRMSNFDMSRHRVMISDDGFLRMDLSPLPVPVKKK